jgi:hypothetical protein
MSRTRPQPAAARRAPVASPGATAAATALATACVLLLTLATAAAGQRTGTPTAAMQPAPQDTAAASGSAPQTFHWWTGRGVPATTPWGQPVDTAATRMLLSWTTSAEFTNPLVDHLPYDAGVVSPRDHWGYPSGRPGHLHRVDELYGYYQALANSSPRVRFDLLDATEEGNRFALVQVGSEANLARLEEIRRGYHRLTDPRQTTQAEADAIIRELPVIYLVHAGLHSPETGHAEVAPELAYRVAVSEDPMIREIRDDVVLFIMPVTEPDGRNRVVDWYRLHGADVVEYEDRIPGPPFWGRYIRHDNNRDGLQLTLALSRQVVDLFQHWRYPIGLDLHESVPFLYISTGTGPYNPNIDPITRHEWQWMAHYEVTALTSHGMPGVWTHDFFDGWNPAYMVFTLNNRNAVGRFYETYGNSLPQTFHRRVEGNRTSEEWFRANPPYREVTWSLRNNINYAQSGVLHGLHFAATNRETVLRNYWRKANNSLERGRTQAPYAYVIPADQARRADAAHLLNLLARHGIELHRAGGAGSFRGTDILTGGSGDVAVRAGDYVIRMDQPYRDFVKNLMEIQNFPENAPRPYDDVAWTLPLLYNVTAHEIADRRIFELAAEPVTGAVQIPGAVRTVGRGAPQWWVVRYAASSHALQARHHIRDVSVLAAREAFDVPGAGSFAAGTWLIPASALTQQQVEQWAARFGLDVVGTNAAQVAQVPMHRQDFPRIALLHTWRNTQDDGSVRYAFDTMGIPYDYVPENRLREGNLRARYDVILFPDQGRSASARQIFEGVDPRQGPLPYLPSPEYPSLGVHSQAADITGGMGYEGLLALRDFAEAGGTLIFEGSASTLPVEFGLVRGVSLRTTTGLFSPGSIVRGRVANRSHPIGWGYDDEVPVFDRFGPYLGVPARMNSNVIVRFAPTADVFMSGLVAGRNQLGGQPAVVSVPLGEGNVVLFGIRALHRNQTQGSFAFVWNALLNWQHLGLGIEAEMAGVVDSDYHDH